MAEAGAGRYRDRVTVERAVAGVDGYGNAVTGWATHLHLWADVLEALGREQLAAGRLESTTLARIRVRGSAAARGVTAADRVVARGQVWNIRSIAAVGRDGAVIEWTVEAGVAA